MEINSAGNINPIRSRGLSLVEVLVAVVLITSALTGLAASQSNAQGVASRASLRSLAVLSAGDMVERMRANSDGARRDAYTAPAGNRGQFPDCSNSGSNCTSSEIAAADLLAWRDRIDRVLPNGLGQVTSTGSGAVRTYSVTIGWVRNSGRKTAHPITKSTCATDILRRYCFTLDIRL